MIVHPRCYGRFDNASRYLLTDPVVGEGNHCKVCDRCLRSPSRAWPYSVYKHCFTQRHERRIAEAVEDGRLAHLAPLVQAADQPVTDIGPSTACWECGALVAVGMVYLSAERDGAALCPACFAKAEAAGRARVREDA